MKRRTDGPAEERIVPDGVPDYNKRLSKAEKLIWEKEYSNEFGKRKYLQFHRCASFS